MNNQIPLCICGHALNLHKYGLVDCNGTKATGLLGRRTKCPCMVFTNPQQITVAPSQKAYNNLDREFSPPNISASANIALEQQPNTVKKTLSREEILAQLSELQKQLQQ